jgi:hypothetical protein
MTPVPEPPQRRQRKRTAGNRVWRRGPAAGAAVLLAFALLGPGANAAQAVTDTFKAVFQDNDNVLAGYNSSGSGFTTTRRDEGWHQPVGGHPRTRTRTNPSHRPVS